MVENLSKDINLNYYRNMILKWYLYSIILSSTIMFIYGIITRSNYWIFSLIVSLASLVILIILKRGKYNLSVIIQIFFTNIAILIQAMITRSAYLATLLGLILICSTILSSNKVAWGVFLLDIVVVIIYCIFGIFSSQQTFHPATQIATVDNISVLIPTLIISFGISQIIYHILINLIQQKEQQNRLLLKTQASLIHQKKIESIQILAGGVAHDFNNILTSLIGGAELLKMDEKMEPESKEIVQDMINASNQAKNLTNTLLTFSKGNVSSETRKTDLSKILPEVIDFSIRGRKSKVNLNISPNIPSIMINEEEIIQVIQNLVINSDQAMEKGGIITVSMQTINTSQFPDFNLEGGNFIHISIQDEGKGIPESIQDHIFDPFFTTKTNGTGLGLALCNSIIQKHHGYLKFKSIINKGTAFHIFLPILTE
ncbi:Adaptive-response sensory-kinase SasA [Candidatus Lokiarchaeum ossiferum]|uniref:Adaptive-response sensory-kinase SasA n=1 Tax=Candidatus Lokiarchaeum ossiferum TaxID=2951803 RepID=A0ABY6HNA6_9ARCH|nr:Adaptive-response sensory-kinase SasA [Candidatus Lokiarchaeum sp. B-35]